MVACRRAGDSLGVYDGVRGQNVEEDGFQNAPSHYHRAFPSPAWKQHQGQFLVIPLDDFFQRNQVIAFVPELLRSLFVILARQFGANECCYIEGRDFFGLVRYGLTDR